MRYRVEQSLCLFILSSMLKRYWALLCCPEFDPHIIGDDIPLPETTNVSVRQSPMEDPVVSVLAAPPVWSTSETGGAITKF